MGTLKMPVTYMLGGFFSPKKYAIFFGGSRNFPVGNRIDGGIKWWKVVHG